MNHYLAEAAAEIGVPAKVLSAEARNELMNMAWPGNVRQLVNVCRRLTALAPGREIRVQDLPGDLSRGRADALDWSQQLMRWATTHLENSSAPLLNRAVPAFERTLIQVALAKTQGKRQRAAALLGWGRNTLTRKMKELDM
jgi:two-component system nitrogen regulation response regulator GlnG